MKKKLKITLALLLIGIAAIVSSTIFNNKLYYENRDYLWSSEIIRSARLIGNYYNQCLIDFDSEICQKKLFSLLESSWDMGEIQVFSGENKLLFNLDKETYQNEKFKRYAINRKFLIGSGKDKIVIIVNKLNNPPVHTAIYEAFFSTQENAKSYYKRANIFIMSIVVFICLWILTNFMAIIEKQYDKIEDQNVRLNASNRVLEDKRKELLDEVIQHAEKSEFLEKKVSSIQSVLKNKDLDNAELNEVCELLLTENSQNQARVKQLEEEIKTTANQNSSNIDETFMEEFSVDIKGSRNDLIYNLHNSEVKFVPSIHHGREIVEEMYQVVQSDPVASSFVRTVQSGPYAGRYNKNKKNRAVLSLIRDVHPKKDRDGYLLSVYDKEGYCVEIYFIDAEEDLCMVFSSYLIGSKGIVTKRKKFKDLKLA